MRTLEQLRGRGLIVGEGVEAKVSYAFRVTEETIRVGHYADPGATIPGLKSISGQVTFNDPVQEPGLLGKKLVLHLEDGRRLTVLLTSLGQIEGTGGFFLP